MIVVLIFAIELSTSNNLLFVSAILLLISEIFKLTLPLIFTISSLILVSEVDTKLSISSIF